MNQSIKDWQLKKQYYQIPQGIIKRILKESEKVKSTFSQPYQKLIPYFTQKEELFAMCHEFFAYFPFLEENYKMLATFEKKTSFILQQSNSKYHGLTVRDWLGKPSFKLYYNYSLEDLIVLNHEYAHGFYWQNFYTYEEQPFLSELEGYFFEYLTLTFLKEKKIITLSEEKKIENNDVQNIKEMFFKFMHGYNYINGTDHTLSNQYYLKTKQVNLEEEAIYIYSYLVNSYLKQMAKNDLEKSFYYFKRLKEEKNREEAKLILKNLKHC